jgi:hypothetical protein
MVSCWLWVWVYLLPILENLYVCICTHLQQCCEEREYYSTSIIITQSRTLYHVFSMHSYLVKDENEKRKIKLFADYLERGRPARSAAAVATRWSPGLITPSFIDLGTIQYVTSCEGPQFLPYRWKMSWSFLSFLLFSHSERSNKRGLYL